MTNKAKAAREAAGISAREAAELVGVASVTWQVWEGQTRRKTEIPFATLEYFKLVTGIHEDYALIKK
jgi:DNA-binding XRE family transcriptional regulator